MHEGQTPSTARSPSRDACSLQTAALFSTGNRWLGVYVHPEVEHLEAEPIRPGRNKQFTSHETVKQFTQFTSYETVKQF